MELDKQAIYVLVAGIITALADTGGSPESNLYILCDMDMQKYRMVRFTLVEAGLVTIKGNYVRLTEAGKETAKRVEAVLKNKPGLQTDLLN